MEIVWDPKLKNFLFHTRFKIANFHFHFDVWLLKIYSSDLCQTIFPLFHMCCQHLLKFQNDLTDSFLRKRTFVGENMIFNISGKWAKHKMLLYMKA